MMKPRTVRALALVFFSLPFAWGCAAKRATVVPTPTTAGAGSDIYHEIGAGQTLWRIAKVYGVDVNALARANRIQDPDALEIGTRLLVPGATVALDVPPYPEPLPGSAPYASIVPDSGFAWPVTDGRILSRFGVRRGSRNHEGLDIGGHRGEPVSAALDGRVVYAGSTMRGYGKTVVLDHGRGLTTLYAHGAALLVQEGEWVRQGQRIARVGRTGNATTDHCHFEVRRDGVPVNPMHYLSDERGAR